MSNAFKLRHAPLLNTPVLNRSGILLGALLCVHLVLAEVAGVGAFLLRHEFRLRPNVMISLLWGMGVWAVVKPATFYVLRSLRGWRRFSNADVPRLAGANLVASALAFAAIAGLTTGRLSSTILWIDFLLCFLLTAGARFTACLMLDHLLQSKQEASDRTLIYGAGEAGFMLLEESRRNPRFGYAICGLIDDVKRQREPVRGVRILGRGEDLPQLVKEHKISKVLIAIPSADNAQMLRITSLCRDAGVEFRTMPSVAEILAGSNQNRVREVAVEDVLGRSSVRLDDTKISNKVAGQVVLVTGAAGSIGSELCRQVARYGPAKLVAFELSETALFFLEREMRESFPELDFSPEVGNIQNLQRVRDVFALYTPSLVLHAAAYKHVPLMEKHIFEAVENNVIGTYNLGVAASEYAVADFVMISSDKAVNPTNMMGTTKRVAELVVRSMQESRTCFISVRFGNVLGSNGSVIPIFKKQIAAGGPVTITHPNMERFFMTIPEASQLVLQACTMGRGGEIFVLDMGQPIKIVDLARQLIQLSGLRPDIDIPIQFTGMRPGEKLFEELNMADEAMVNTPHEKIKIFAGNCLLPERMSSHLHRLRKACTQRNARALVKELKMLVPEYKVSKEIQALTMTESLVQLGLVLQSKAEEAVVLTGEAKMVI